MNDVIYELTDMFSFLNIADAFPPSSQTEPRFVSSVICLFSEHIQIVIKIAVKSLGRILLFCLTVKDQMNSSQ